MRCGKSQEGEAEGRAERGTDTFLFNMTTSTTPLTPPPYPPPPPATFFVYGPVAGHKCSIIKAKGLPSGYQASSDKPPRQKHLQSNLQADKPTNCQNRQTNKLEMKRKYIITNNNFGIHNFFLSTDISASFYISRVPPRPS